MKKVIVLLFLIPGYLLQPTHSQNGFEILFDGVYSTYADIVVSSPNGNSFVIVSEIYPSTPWPQTVSYYIYKISPSGDTLRWTYKKQDTLIMYAQLLYDKVTGNILIYGIGNQLINNGTTAVNSFLWLASINEDFTLNWERTYHFAPLDYHYSFHSKFLQLSDSTFIVAFAAEKGAGGPGNRMTSIYRFNSTGDSLYYKEYPWYSSGLVYALTYAPDSSNIWIHYARYVSGDDNNNVNCQVIDINTYDSIMTYFYPLHNSTPIYEFSAPYSAKILSGNKFVAAGMYDIYNGQIVDYIGALKFDAEFNVLVEKMLTTGNTTDNIQIYPASDNCIDYVYPNQIYVSGAFKVPPGNFNYNDDWIYVTKLDDSLNIIWEKYLGGDAFYRVDGMCATYDGGVIVTGRRFDENINYLDYDGFLYKFDYNGYVGINDISTTKIKNAIIYPNPSENGIIYLRTAINNANFFIFDLSGKTVKNVPINKIITGIDIRSLLNGEYVWILINREKVVETGKFIKK